MTLKLKSMPHAILQLVATGAFAAAVQPALAQQATPDAAAPVQRVVVTGTFISRADSETPSPVQTLSSEDLKRSGYTSVSDVLRDITSNGQGTLSQGFNRAFASGASGVSLRGLTVGATLVLIDGHRMAPYPLSDDGQRPFVDISNIPFDAVERIDILKDGASAAYGSDAIAGVVNVILKKTFVGTSINAETGRSTQGGGATNHFSVTHGWGDLDKDGYTAYVGAEYRHQNAILFNQRTGHDWSRTDWTPLGGENDTPGAVNSGTVLPRPYVPYLYNPAGTGGTNNPANFVFLNAPGSCPSLAALQANQCTFTDPWAQLQPQTENINFIGSFTKKLGDDWSLNFKLSSLESKDHVVTRPDVIPAGSFTGNVALGPGIAPHAVGVINPFLLPANYPGNTLHVPVRAYGYLTDLGGRVDDVDSTSYRAVVELTGSAGGWDMNLSGGLTKIFTKQAYRNYIDRTALFAALNSPNPYLITGGNSAAANAAISPTAHVTQTDSLNFIEGRGTHSLMTLAGGDMQISLGASYIAKSLNSPDVWEAQTGQLSINTAYAMGQQKNTAAYFELYAPVLKNLELDVAGRYDHYNTYGHSQTPKFGFKYAPAEQLTLRGTYARGFRAPGPAENGSAGSSFGFNQVNDPLMCPGGVTTTAGNVAAFCKFGPAYVQTTTPDLKPEKSKSYTLGAIIEPVKGWSTTIDYYNIKLDNQIVTAASLPDYVPQFVRGTPVPQIISDGNGGTFTAIPVRNGQQIGPILYATSGYRNAGGIKTKGLDFDMVYKIKMGEFGNLKPELNVSHTISYKTIDSQGNEFELAGTHGPTVISGDTGIPKNRAQFILNWDKGPWSATATVNWIDSFSVLDPSTGPGANDTCDNSIQNSNTYFNNLLDTGGSVPTQFCRVKSFTSTDLSATYKWGNWTFRASVLNAFNRQPPVDAQTYGGSSLANSNNVPYNAALHQAGAVGRFWTLGANYRF